MIRIGNSYLDAIDTILEDSSDEFLFGHKPSTYDASLYAFLSAILEIQLECPLQQYAQSMPRLVNYVQQLSHRYGWSESGTATVAELPVAVIVERVQ